MTHPKNLKVRQVATVTQNFRDYGRSVDLSFALQECGYDIPTVNTSITPLAPNEACATLESALPQMIAAVAEEKESDGPF